MTTPDPDLSSKKRDPDEPPAWFAIAFLLFISWVLYLIVQLLIQVIQ